MDRLRQRADFLAVANGARVTSAAFTLQGRRRQDLGPIRIGFTVRRLDIMDMRPHHDYVLVGRRAALGRDFAALVDDLRNALRRLDRQAAKAGPARTE
jgi:ribonuclease P protein component